MPMTTFNLLNTILQLTLLFTNSDGAREIKIFKTIGTKSTIPKAVAGTGTEEGFLEQVKKY